MSSSIRPSLIISASLCISSWCGMVYRCREWSIGVSIGAVHIYYFYNQLHTTIILHLYYLK